ncbi:hypothetical protein ALP71_03098 [Pseudomonas coronafaciens pv. garcae]|nr:hypothetical protein ALP71_03098 [Pseudomonas coronafaciens pv. garcae]
MTCASRIVLEVRAKVEIGEAYVGQRSAVVELADRHDVFELGTIAVPRIFIAGAIVFPLVATVQVGRQIDPRVRVDVSAETAVQRVRTVGRVAAVVVDPVERNVPFLERPYGQAASCQVVDGDARFVFHEQRRAMIPDAFVIIIADAEDLRHVHIAVQFKRPLAAEVLVFQIDVIVGLGAEADVLASDQRQVLIEPV